MDWNVSKPASGSTPVVTGVPLCGTGMNQSPINLADELITYNAPLGPLQIQ